MEMEFKAQKTTRPNPKRTKIRSEQGILTSLCLSGIGTRIHMEDVTGVGDLVRRMCNTSFGRTHYDKRSTIFTRVLCNDLEPL